MGIACVFLVGISPFLIKKSDVKPSENKVILTVWQIDSFEGGTGSRTAFIKDVATTFCKQNSGVYILVSSFTVESANEHLLNGIVPDVISCGACGLNLGGLAKELGGDLWGGSVGNKTYAVAFLRGGYFSIEKGGGSKEIIISKGKYNHPYVACLCSNIRGESYVEKEPQEAFSYFVRSSKATMIGTQRDIVRLKNYGEEFTATPLPEYSDLIQYLSLTSRSELGEHYGRRFIEYLLSDIVQQKITKLKMLSPTIELDYVADKELTEYQKLKINYVASPFASLETLNNLEKEAKTAVINGYDSNSIINFLKQL